MQTSDQVNVDANRYQPLRQAFSPSCAHAIVGGQIAVG
jgi:hypothetical protein